MASLKVVSTPQQPTLNPKVVITPTQPVLAPKVVSKPAHPTLAPRVVTQPTQPTLNPQVQQPQTRQINVDNSPRFIPLGDLVKSKYPGVYDSYDSGELGKIVATKYPGVYDQFIDPGEAPQPEEQGTPGLKGFGLGALKGIGSTVANISSLGQKGLEKLTGVSSNSPTAKVTFGERLAPNGTAEKVGFGVEQAAEFFAPAGIVSKASKAADLAVQGLNLGSKATKVLGLAGKVGIGATEAASVTGLQGGDKEEIRNAAIFGGLLPIGLSAIKKLGTAAKEVAKFTSSSLSGVPKDAIEYALKNPQKVQSAIKLAVEEGGDSAAQRIYKNTVNALDELKSARRLNYESGLAKLEREATYTKNGQLYVRRVLSEAEAKATKGYVPGTQIGVPTNLTTSGIKKVATTTLKDFDIKAKGRVIDWSEAAIDSSHGKKLQEVVNRIYDWTDTTPKGLDRLRKIIDGYRLGGIQLGSSEKQFNTIIGRLRTSLNEYVDKRVPQVGEMRAKYHVESEVIDNVRRQLKVGSADPNTALRKLVNVFNPKSQVYRPIVEQLGEKAGVDLMSDIAALTMIQWTPGGLGKYLTGLSGIGGIGLGFVNPAALATLPVTAAASSPRVIGKAATSFGKLDASAAGNTIKKATRTLGLGIGTQLAR